MTILRVTCVFAAALGRLTVPGGNSDGGEKKAVKVPIVMPPSGEGDRLVGRLKYPSVSDLAFDSRNRPYILGALREEDMGHILTLRDGTWVKLSFLDELREAHPEFEGFLRTGRGANPSNHAGAGRIFIDDADRIYVTVSFRYGEPFRYKHQGRVGGHPRKGVLIYSPDLGESFQIYPGAGALPRWMPHADNSGPPVLVSNRVRKDKPPVSVYSTRWRTVSVVTPVIKDGRLAFPPPVQITDRSLMGVGWVTRDGKTHFAVGEMPQSEKLSDGAQFYAITYDHAQHKVTGRTFLYHDHGVDDHNYPRIAIDSKKHLHVVTGGHHTPFMYLKSLKPGDVSGWTKPAGMGVRKQTYCSLTCDRDDRLHCSYRLKDRIWTVVVQSKDAGEAASAWSNPTRRAGARSTP